MRRLKKSDIALSLVTLLLIIFFLIISVVNNQQKKIYQSKAAYYTTPTRSISPTPSSTVTPTPNPNCLCSSDACTSSCTFDKYADVNYNNPIKCSRESSIIGPTPNATGKTAYCQRSERTKGDVDGDGVVTNTDYYYYVSAVNGGGIPAIVDPDVNGDGLVSPDDRAIIVRTLGGI